jgi:hypothetical protein
MLSRGEMAGMTGNGTVPRPFVFQARYTTFLGSAEI